MGRLFSYDNLFFRTMAKLVDVVCLNIIFIIFSLPIVTIGASVTAMMSVTMKMARDREGYMWRGFWKSFKQNFKQATIIWMLVLLAAGILGGDIYFFWNLDASYGKILQSVIVALAFFAVCTVTYVFPLLAQFENTVGRTLLNAVLIAIRHLPWTILLLVIFAVFLVLLVIFLPIVLSCGFGLLAFLTSYIYNHIFAFYIPEEDKDTY